MVKPPTLKHEARERAASPAVLVIAGSDSSGGAGLVRDVRTLADFNIAALCAITTVTAQSHTEVIGVHHIASLGIQQQIAAAFATHRIDAIKIGMLGTSATVTAVTGSLANLDIPIVLDPVLVASSGGTLLDAAGVTALVQLLPLITLLTPNLPEAAALLSTTIAATEVAMVEQAHRLLQLGPQAVLIKGGHAAGDYALDVLVTKNQPPLRLNTPRVDATMRGTGCALASAIAGLLALGTSMPEACRGAKHYVLQKLLLTRMAST